MRAPCLFLCRKIRPDACVVAGTFHLISRREQKEVPDVTHLVSHLLL